MSAHSIGHVPLQLDENEAVQLARAVQILVKELGFDHEEVERSYSESLAYFLKNDHGEQDFRGDANRNLLLTATK
jgi:hypothetical protein